MTLTAPHTLAWATTSPGTIGATAIARPMTLTGPHTLAWTTTSPGTIGATAIARRMTTSRTLALTILIPVMMLHLPTSTLSLHGADLVLLLIDPLRCNRPGSRYRLTAHD